MSDTLSATPPPEKEDPETLVLRGRPRPVVRFRRGLIIAATAAVAASLVSLTWLALDPPTFGNATSTRVGQQPLGKVAHDSLAGLPSDYGDVPRLGPPLPGDLGGPILEHRRSLGDGAFVNSGTRDIGGDQQRASASAEAQRQRTADRLEAARSSPVLVHLRNSAAETGISLAPTATQPDRLDSAGEAGPPDRRPMAGLTGSADGGLSPKPLGEAPSAFTLSAGTIIPASLITGLNSDLPGIVIAQVTENVRDSATGKTTLIPQGARLIGSYDSSLGYGQRRALLVWTRIVFPDGSSVGLDELPATDPSGYSGVRDRVDSHMWQLLKGVALSTLLGVGTQVSLGSSESELVRAIRRSTQNNAADAGDRVTARNLSVEPTITVRPGWPVRAVVNSDLVLEPWTG